MKSGPVILLFLLCALSACNVKRNLADIESIEPSASSILYFQETGHTIEAPFVNYYLQHNGLQRLGYPISQALDHEGWQVQYFQFGRLEAHPENHPDYFITVGWLGQRANRTTPPVPQPPNSEIAFFAESGHTLSGDFLSYFKAHGNTVQFGYPISEPFLLNGYVQQDFQSTRFIWLPFSAGAGRVELEPLGETYFLSSGLPTHLLNPINPPPQAQLFVNPNEVAVLPDDAQSTLTIEQTPNPNYIRLKARVLVDGQPLANFKTRLVWQDQSQALPPTRASGQSHLLLNISDLTNTDFFLYTADGNILLAQTMFKRGQ